MKKMSKGFTLVELIIVMAIMTILMTGLMQLMKPIRSTYVDSTLYESQRNVENGIGQYITESVRYATDIGIYSSCNTNVGNVKTAEELFMKAVTGLTPSQYASADATEKANYESIRNRLQVITIDNNKYTYNNKDWSGRLVRKKVTDLSGSTTQLLSTDDDKAGTTSARLALGDAYYGDTTYSIKLKADITASDLDVVVSCEKQSALNTTPLVSTTSTVLLQNVSVMGGVYDTTYYTCGSSTDPSSTADKEKTFIVFLSPIG